MIELILRSGMGNQMFEYAYARKMQSIMPEKIAINNAYMEKHDFRKYSLHHFKLNEDVYVLNDKDAKRHLKLFYLKIPFAFGKDFFKWRILHQQALGEEKYIRRSNKGLYYAHLPYESYSIENTKRKIKFLFGFFQNYSTVDDMEEILRKEFEIVTPPSEKNKLILDEIKNCNSVCLHIRRGDYLNPKWKSMQVCTEKYYYSAVEEAKRVLDNPVFYVFSTGHEDIEWIKTNYKFNANVKYVDLDNPDYEELRLMKNCRHFIISNSTFSWWAAYLSDNKEKKVWSPSVWNKDDFNSNAIYPKTWSKIEV